MRSSILVLMAFSLAACHKPEVSSKAAPTSQERPGTLTPADPPRPSSRHEKPEIPAGAEQLKIHWPLKIPELRLQGEWVVRDAEAWRALLNKCGDGRKAQLHERWNGLDFQKQMAIVVGRVHSSCGYDHEIDSVWRTAKEIVVVIAEHCPDYGSPVLWAFDYPISGVAVNRSDLPVRFVSYVP